MEHCRNCDGPFRTSGEGCLVPVLSCCTITLGHTRPDAPLISCRGSPWRCLIAPCHFYLFSNLKKFLSCQCQRFLNDRVSEMSVTQWFQSKTADVHDKGTQKFVPRYGKCLNLEAYVLKNSTTLAVSVPINLFIKLGFVSVNATCDTNFVDTLPTDELD